MYENLIRAGCFVAIIVLGFVLRRIGVFREGDFRVLSQITLKITLPAAIIVSFSQMTIKPSMLIITLLALCGGIVYIGAAFLLNLRTNKEQRAFDIVNLPGYNIGLFAIPFVQSSLGPVGMVTASLFDAGNAFVCLGGAYGVASAVKDGVGFSFKRIGKALLTSVPFMCYVIMLILNFTGLKLPDAVLSLAEIIRGANTFMAMLMIGVGLNLQISDGQLRRILKIVIVRYALAAVFSFVLYFVLPLDLEIRQALVLLVFSPISSATPAFTGELKSDVGTSSTINSICILCSIVVMTILMTVMV